MDETWVRQSASTSALTTGQVIIPTQDHCIRDAWADGSVLRWRKGTRKEAPITVKGVHNRDAFCTKGAFVHMDQTNGTTMDVRRHFHGRPAAHTWTPHGARLDVWWHADGRNLVHANVSAIRKRIADPGAMKDRKSKLLRGVLTELNRPVPDQG